MSICFDKGFEEVSCLHLGMSLAKVRCLLVDSDSYCLFNTCDCVLVDETIQLTVEGSIYGYNSQSQSRATVPSQLASYVDGSWSKQLSLFTHAQKRCKCMDLCSFFW